MPDSKLLLLSLLTTLTAAAAPQLRLSTNNVGPLVVQSGGNTPQPQVVNAFNVGDGALNLSIVSFSVPWLNATIGQPTTCANGPVAACIPITISAASPGLDAGTYNEFMVVADPNAIDSPQTINVTVQVNGTPTNNIDLYVTPNLGASTAQSDTAALTINTGGTVISTATTADGGPWLSFSIVGNQVTYTAYRLRVTSQVGQAEGNYTGTVVISGSNFQTDNRTLNVTMHVTSQPIVQVPTAPITFNLVQGQALSTYNYAFQNLGQGTLQFNGATTTAEWLSALPPRTGSTVGISANPGSLAPGSYYGTLRLLSNAANSSVPIPVRLNIAPAGIAQLAVGGVVDNAGFVAGQAVAAGSIAAVFGSQLSSSGPAFASGFPLPTTLGGVQVLINGTPAPLFYADAGQVDVQIPYSLAAGQVILQVRRDGQPGNRVSATIDSVAPRLFTLRQFSPAPDGTPYGMVLNSDGTYALPQNFGVPAHPAHPGDIVTIYALGLGPTTPFVNTGDAAPASSSLTSSIQVMFGAGSGGAVSATPIYAGLAPTFAGLYQINVLIPTSAPTGNVAVSLTMPGHASNLIDMAIAAPSSQ